MTVFSKVVLVLTLLSCNIAVLLRSDGAATEDVFTVPKVAEAVKNILYMKSLSVVCGVSWLKPTKEKDIVIKKRRQNKRSLIGVDRSILRTIFTFLQNRYENVMLDKSGVTTLFRASEIGYVSVVEELLERYGIEVNIANREGATPLFVACKNGRLELVEMLLEKKEILVNKAHNFSQRYSEYAHGNGTLSWESIWRCHKDWFYNAGLTPLAMACQEGHLEIVTRLLERQDIDVNSFSADRITPLLVACQEGNLQVVQKLLEHKDIDVNRAGSFGKEISPLMLVAINGNLDIVEKLLEHPDIVLLTDSQLVTYQSETHFCNMENRAKINQYLCSQVDSPRSSSMPRRVKRFDWIDMGFFVAIILAIGFSKNMQK